MTVMRHKAHLCLTPSILGSDPSLIKGCRGYLGHSSLLAAALNGPGVLSIADVLRQSLGWQQLSERACLTGAERGDLDLPCSPSLAQTQSCQWGLWGLSPAQGHPLSPRLVSPEVPRSPSQTPEQGGANLTRPLPPAACVPSASTLSS